MMPFQRRKFTLHYKSFLLQFAFADRRVGHMKNDDTSLVYLVDIYAAGSIQQSRMLVYFKLNVNLEKKNKKKFMS